MHGVHPWLRRAGCSSHGFTSHRSGLLLGSSTTFCGPHRHWPRQGLCDTSTVPASIEFCSPGTAKSKPATTSRGQGSYRGDGGDDEGDTPLCLLDESAQECSTSPAIAPVRPPMRSRNPTGAATSAQALELERAGVVARAFPDVGLRITIGSPAENDRWLATYLGLGG